MATVDATRSRLSPTRALVAAAVAVAGLVALSRAVGLADSSAAQAFTIIFTAIVVEALPFVLLGAAVSAVIEVYVSDRAFGRLARLPLSMQLPAAALGGIAFPVCECGSVPVARRLIGKGMHPAAGVAFMLASPILNPIVLASTWVAYAPRGVAVEMLLGRAGLGLVVAIAAGWALGADRASGLLRAAAADTATPAHQHDDGMSRPRRFLGHLGGDFFFMGKFLIVGAALAAALQTAVPQSVISGLAATPVIGSLGLMAVAYVSSLCSEADAFVAVSFTQFPLGSQLAFLVFGPVLDIKLSFLYAATFTRRFVPRLLVVSIPLVLAGALVFEVILR